MSSSALALAAAQTPPRALYGVVGWPVGHSLSPLLHTQAFQLLGHPGAYMAMPVPPDRISGFLAAARTGALSGLPLSGLSVTIPHKAAAMAVADEVSERARRVGAVNTLVWRDGLIFGDNTDVAGFLAPLRDLPKPESALVLGAGGAAAGVLAGLEELGVTRVTVTARTRERAEETARPFGARIVDWEERDAVEAVLVVNATPLGMSGRFENETPYPAERFEPGMTAYDLVYVPARTRFLREAEAHGAATIPGLPMFVAQAQAQCRLWTGREFPADWGAAIVEAALTMRAMRA